MVQQTSAPHSTNKMSASDNPVGGGNSGAGFGGHLMFQPNEEAVTQIMILGFTRNAAIRVRD